MNYFRTTYFAIQEENNDASRTERERKLNAAKLYRFVNNNLDHVHIYSGTYLRSYLITSCFSLSVSLAKSMRHVTSNLLSESLIEKVAN